jgi:hypothetical protein
VAVGRGAHRLMEHIQGFNRSHWMLPSGKCLRCIAPAATMVNEFVERTLNTNKHLPSNYGEFRSLVDCENFVTPKQTLYSAHRCRKPRKNVRRCDWR